MMGDKMLGWKTIIHGITMYRIDAFLLDRVFQPIADFIQIKTGITSHLISAQMYSAYMALLLADFGLGIMRWSAGGFTMNGFIGDVFIQGLILPLVIRMVVVWYREGVRLHDNVMNSSHTTQINVHRLSGLVFRLITGLFLLVNLYMIFVRDVTTISNLIGDLAILLIFLASHFQALTPKPPSRSFQTQRDMIGDMV